MRYISSISQQNQPTGIFLEENTGIGDDSNIIRRNFENLLVDYYKPLSRQWANPIIRFSNFKREWKESTPMFSSITEIVMHPSYQRIIGMGPTAIPMILLSMRQELDHWFWALSAITGENPVPEEHRGKIKKMTEAWLDWGQKNFYLE
jgi:hypothetical protein